MTIPTRARGRCECVGQCGLHRGRRCAALQGKPARFDGGRVVELAVVFLDGDEANAEAWNQLAVCRQCRLPLECRATTSERLERQGQETLPLDLDRLAFGGAH